MVELEKYLSENTAIYGNDFQKKESRWFNGKNYYPSYKYKIATEQLRVVYDYLSNDLSTSSALVPSKSDFHVVKISCKVDVKNVSNFKIIGKTFLWRLINRKKFQVKTKNTQFEKLLQNNKIINQLFTTYFDPEFSPIIRGERKHDYFVVSFRFTLIRFNSEIFDLVSEFLKEFEQKINEENPSMSS